MIALGLLNAGSSVTIDVQFFQEAALAGEPLVYVLAAEPFESAYCSLCEGALQDAVIRDGYVSGSVEAQPDSILFSTLLYSEGWVVTVNGKRVEVAQVEQSLLGVPLEAGTNAVDLRYVPPGFNTGLATSCASILLLLFLAFRKTRNRNKQ